MKLPRRGRNRRGITALSGSHRRTPASYIRFEERFFLPRDWFLPCNCTPFCLI